MAKKEKIKPLNKNKVKTINIYLNDLEKLEIEEQEKYFEDMFDKIYSGRDIESLRKYSLRCIKLSCDPKDSKIHLPYGVIAEKKKNIISIKVSRNKNIFLMTLFLTFVSFLILGAIFVTVSNFVFRNLNKDIDNDGIPDINLDLNDDKIAEVNIDNNNDDKPDVNIDYKGNRKPTFNIDMDNNGVADYNLTNQDINNDNKCDLNCDVNDDGWPDTNLDLDGDGIADMNIDKDGDGRPDLNFDMNNDNKCDMHCDTDNDLVCDFNCLTDDEINNMDPVDTGSSSSVGSSRPFIKSEELVIEYADEKDVFITGIFPDDQPGYENNVPVKKFKVTNKSSLYIKYNLKWIVDINDYITDNFMYNIKGTMGGITRDYVTAPKESSAFARDIIIPPYTTQEYEMNFKLRGVGEQNEDQGRTFSGHVEIYLNNEMGT